MKMKTPAARPLALLAAAALVLLSGCAEQPPAYQVYEQPAARSGVVESVAQVAAQPASTGVGAVAGGVAGGVLGSLIGAGTGRTVATIVGAIGGGYVGNEIEKNRAGPLVWEVRVRYDDGGYASIHQSANPDVRPGDRVRVTGTGIELLKR